ncbi:MAG: 30S ribosomal protein S18 [bacterium]
MSYQGGRYQNEELPPEVTYKRPDLLEDYVDEEYKVLPRRRTRLSANQQRRLTREIKRARQLALLPYTEH